MLRLTSNKSKEVASFDAMRRALGKAEWPKFLTILLVYRSLVEEPISFESCFRGPRGFREFDGKLIVNIIRRLRPIPRDWRRFTWIFELKEEYFLQLISFLSMPSRISKLSSQSRTTLNAQVEYFLTKHPRSASKVDPALVNFGLRRKRMSPEWRAAVKAACWLPMAEERIFSSIMYVVRSKHHSAGAVQTIARVLWSRQCYHHGEFMQKCAHNSDLARISHRHAADAKSSAIIDAQLLLKMIASKERG